MEDDQVVAEFVFAAALVTGEFLAEQLAGLTDAVEHGLQWFTLAQSRNGGIADLLNAILGEGLESALVGQNDDAAFEQREIDEQAAAFDSAGQFLTAEDGPRGAHGFFLHFAARHQGGAQAGNPAAQQVAEEKSGA